MIFIRLVTIQPREVLEILNRRGRFVCDIHKTDNRDYSEISFRDAYDWLASQMAERIGQPPADTKYPIWAWYRNDDDFSDWGEAGREYAIITLEIDPWRVVLSDYDDWNAIIGHYPIIHTADEAEFDAEWERYMNAGRRAIERSWKRVFHSDGDYVQATFWELFKEDIVSISTFISTGIIPDTALG